MPNGNGKNGEKEARRKAILKVQQHETQKRAPTIGESLKAGAKVAYGRAKEALSMKSTGLAMPYSGKGDAERKRRIEKETNGK